MVRLRQATSADDAFCFHLNDATMREYVESKILPVEHETPM